MFFAPGRYAPAPLLRLRDPQVHATQWHEVMKWDFEFATGHHDPPTVCGPIHNHQVMQGNGGIKGHFKRSLEASGELDNTPVAGSWFPWVYPNTLYKIVQAEPGFQEMYGKELPVLRMGGPGFDAEGLKKK
jgi:hypothetical protein